MALRVPRMIGAMDEPPMQSPEQDHSPAGRTLPGWVEAMRQPWVVIPVIGVVAVAVAWSMEPNPLVLVLLAPLLAGSVFAAVHHAEIVAHRVGEPYGSLVLAVAVTIIEVALIVTLMVTGGPETAALARDTVFAAVMITCNGILGISVLIGALRGGVARFNAEGMASALATVATLATLSLVLPTVTTSTPSGEFSQPQLVFAALASLTLYGVLVLIQTVRHRDLFVSAEAEADANADDPHAPTNRKALASLGMLVVALVAVVGLAKIESPAIESGVSAIGAPASAVGVVIAMLVLLPESLAAIRNARRNRVQTSLNLAFGSAAASIGLTVPVIAVASIWIDGPLILGLDSTQIVLLVLTIAVASLTLLPGRATVQEGTIHLVLLGAFLVLAVFP